jgi:carbon monoxide dehydrogenase subunit G
MNLEQRFVVAQPVQHVWSAFHAPDLLVACLPGASLAGPEADGELPFLFKVKLGPIAAAFAGKGRLTLDEAAQSGAFAGQASDNRNNSRVKGEARFVLSPDAAGTAVSVAVDFGITGSLAQFSREGIMRALADQLTRQFAQNLQERLAASAEPAAASAPRVPSGAEPGPEAEAPALNLLSLLGAWLRQAWHRMIGKEQA